MIDKLEKDKEKGKNNIFLNPSKKSKTKHKSSGYNRDDPHHKDAYNKNKNNCDTLELSPTSTENLNPFMNKNENIKNMNQYKNIYQKNEYQKININNEELFPELSSHYSSKSGLLLSTLSYKSKKCPPIDFLGAIQCSEPIKKEIFDDIEPGWVVMYFDENKQIKKEYGPSTGITERLEKERIEKHKKEIDQLFEERERDIQERIELFGDERLYKPELEDYREPEIYYGNESDCDENSFTDDILNGDYVGYGDYQDEYI